MQSGCMLKMKHVALLGALAFSSVFAAEVSPNDALCAVKGWMNLKEALGGDFDASPAFVTAYDGEAGKGKFYVVALEGGGYVVASGTHNAGTETITVVDRLCVNDFANGTSKIHTSRLAVGLYSDCGLAVVGGRILHLRGGRFNHAGRWDL